MRVISLISLFPPAVCSDASLYSCAVIEESQPIRCGHALRGVHCRGLAGAFRPSTPVKAERQKP